MSRNRLAADVASHYQFLAHHQPAVDLLAIADQLDVRVTFRPKLPVWGQVVETKAGTGIELRWPTERTNSHEGRYRISPSRFRHAAKRNPRLRFTLAHEIAHVLINRIRGTAPSLADRLQRLTRPEVEWLCDEIGGRLLLPEPWFRRKIVSRPTLQEVLCISNSAQVSLSSVSVRANNLGYRIRLLHLVQREDEPWTIIRSVGFSRSPCDFGLDEDLHAAIRQLHPGELNTVSGHLLLDSSPFPVIAEVQRRRSSCVMLLRPL